MTAASARAPGGVEAAVPSARRPVRSHQYCRQWRSQASCPVAVPATAASRQSAPRGSKETGPQRFPPHQRATAAAATRKQRLVSSAHKPQEACCRSAQRMRRKVKSAQGRITRTPRAAGLRSGSPCPRPRGPSAQGPSTCGPPSGARRASRPCAGAQAAGGHPARCAAPAGSPAALGCCTASACAGKAGRSCCCAPGTRALPARGSGPSRGRSSPPADALGLSCGSACVRKGSSLAASRIPAAAPSSSGLHTNSQYSLISCSL
mmetsp:Transcript_79927/g.242623  ORF Transcript_79927/g.242623 Transcript_79927/m.242623 type:complete len:263 (+) Transcript_79927:903-1691(+)